MDGNDDARLERLDADRIEEGWTRALDTASEAVKQGSRTQLITPAFAARQDELIRAEREWLTRITPALRMLFPPTRSAMMSRH
jgi:hypothetical protein